MKKRPEFKEYNPFFATYIGLVSEGDIEQIISEQIKGTVELLKGLTVEQAHFRYAPDKWTIKEVIGHITDTERIMAYRLLSIARGEKVALPGFNEESYVLHSAFNQLSVEELLENLEAVRHSTTLLLKSLNEDAWQRTGNANGSEITVRALAYIIAGHELHHRNIIQERYMGAENYPQT